MSDSSLIIPKIDHAEIEDRRKVMQPDASDIVEYREYLSGVQPRMLSVKQSNLLGERDRHATINNLLRLVVQSTASRLKLVSWDVEDLSTGASTDGQRTTPKSAERVKDFLDTTWLMNQMARLQYRTVIASLRDGNAAIMLGWRDDRIKFWLEPWWDGKTGLFVFYKDDDTYDYAVKDFKLRIDRTTTIERRNVYMSGMVARFMRKGTDGWTEYVTADEPSAYIPLVRADGSPLPIPIVHFPNDTLDVDSTYGTSEISDLLALQDDLNALQSDISAVGYLTAFQRLFVFGSVPAGEISVSPGGVVGVPGEASLNVVQPGDASGLLSINEAKQQTLATASRTPMHTITGVWPSGAALLQADLPKIDHIEMLGDLFGPRYTMLAHRSTEYANAYGQMDLDENIPIVSVFAPSQRIDEITEIEIKQKRATLWSTLSGLSLTAMIEAGVDPEIAEKIITNKAQDLTVADFGF